MGGWVKYGPLEDVEHIVWVLGIETSCDDTAASVVGPDGIASDVVYSQSIHEEFGGVVPEYAARAHAEKISVVVQSALSKAGIEVPDGVAATAGPGLIGALLVGLCHGKALAAAWDVPFIAVNHLEGHLLAPMLEPEQPKWPFLALLVSGGHTCLYECRGVGDYSVLGETLDDAAGEAFDKVARMLGLGYPGGPVIDSLAKKGNPEAVLLPRPLPGELDFSFSGLKTAVRTAIQKQTSPLPPEHMCASFQTAVVDCLVSRVQAAVEKTGITEVVLGGGVAANSALRDRMSSQSFRVYLPHVSRCTDNGAMIANAGRMHLLIETPDHLGARAQASWALT